LTAQPYVGITGFMNAEQVRGMLQVAKACGLSDQRQLMVGVLVSDKSMRGDELKPEWANKYPDPALADEIFIASPYLLNLVHYNGKGDGLADRLERVVELMPHLDGFQLNIAWPRPRELYKFRQAHPDLKIVLQVGGRALREVGWYEISYHITSLVERLRPYNELVDYFLIDESGGLGIEFDAEQSAGLISQLADNFELKIAPGIGGGLQATNLVAKLGPILAKIPELSWDAEGALRTDDQLDMAKCQAYLEASAAVLFDTGTPLLLE
jgi:hypothetical protein